MSFPAWMGILMKEPNFDIYSGAPDPDKGAVWLASVEGHSKPRERMEQIQYFIFNPETDSILAHRNTFNKPEESSRADTIVAGAPEAQPEPARRFPEDDAEYGGES